MRIGRARLADANWTTITRELVITTLGVLVALALNSWWGERQDRKRESAYLAQMTADIDRSLKPANLPHAVAQEEAAARAAVKLLRAYRTPVPPPRDSIVRWLFATETLGSYTPITSTARALLSTGDVNLIRNDSVRTIIAAVVASMDANTVRLHDYAIRWQEQSGELEKFTDYIAMRAEYLGPAATDSLARSDSLFPMPPAPRKEPFEPTDYTALFRNHDAYRALVKMNTVHLNTLNMLQEELKGLRAVRPVFAPTTH